MNRKEYRDALRGIRFSEEKRQEILAELRKPVPGSVDEILTPPPLQSIRRPAPKPKPEEKTEKERIREEKRRKLEEETMKTEMKMIRYFWPVLAAATLAVAGVFYFARRSPEMLLSTTVVERDGITLRLTAQTAPDSVPKALSNRYDSRANYSLVNDLVRTDTGWVGRVRTKEQIGFLDQDSIYPLTYFDEETGESVVLCARPNCRHDGNEYCTATTTAYEESPLVWYDGYLYTVTSKYAKPGEHHMTYDELEQSKQVLLRYAPDGTEITELATFGSGHGCSRPVVHRGYIWCVVQLQNYGEEVEHPITHDKQKFVSGGWEVWGYELATGKTVKMMSGMGEDTVNHVNQAPALYAAGDCLYIYRQGNDWSGGQGLTEYNLVTGGTNVIINAMSHITSLSNKDVLATNITSGASYTQSLFTGDKSFLPQQLGTPYAIDGRYLYTISTEPVGDGSILSYLNICDVDSFEILKTIELVRNTENEHSDDYWYMHNIGIENIQDGYIYMFEKEQMFDYKNRDNSHAGYGITYCTVEEILNGDNPQWKTLKPFESEVADGE